MEHLIYLLSEYKYLLLFPLAIVEGPIIAVIAGFLCITHLLNPFLAYPIIVLGDITGDSICYMFGRWGVPNFIKKISNWFGLNAEKLGRVKIFFDTHPIRTISLSKITLGIGVAGIYLAGNSRIPYPKFLRVCLATSAIQYIFYLGIGLLFGDAYIQINRYLNYFASITILSALAIVLFILIRKMLKKI
ncbi:MAG: VTT domain-containing protein [Bacteroidetes bacterium]|nr:VTT domain-containing protein [Bacteroidota bacterium]